jgi:hypothetical protein
VTPSARYLELRPGKSLKRASIERPSMHHAVDSAVADEHERHARAVDVGEGGAPRHRLALRLPPKVGLHLCRDVA